MGGEIPLLIYAVLTTSAAATHDVDTTTGVTTTVIVAVVTSVITAVIVTVAIMVMAVMATTISQGILRQTEKEAA